MTSQRDLAKRFARGDDLPLPDASNVVAEPSDEDGLRTIDGEAYNIEAWLVGYNWAGYAARLTSGTVVLFGGWRGYSRSTEMQMKRIDRGFRDALEPTDIVVKQEAKPTVRSRSHAERDAEHRIEKHRNDYPA